MCLGIDHVCRNVVDAGKHSDATVVFLESSCLHMRQYILFVNYSALSCGTRVFAIILNLSCSLETSYGPKQR